MNSTILAIGLGKFNSVLCWYDPDARAERLILPTCSNRRCPEDPGEENNNEPT